MVQKSLLTKLMATLFIIMVAISLVVAIVNYQFANSKLHHNFEEDRAAMIELTNSSIKEAVFAYDFDQVQAIAKSLVNTDLITAVSVVDHRGQVLAKAQDDDKSEGQVTSQGARSIFYSG